MSEYLGKHVHANWRPDSPAATPPVSLPDALREKLDAYFAAIVEATKNFHDAPAYLAQVDAREKLEAALVPYLADAARWRYVRDSSLRFGLLAELDHVMERDFADDLTAAIDAASRAVPPAPGTDNG